MRIAGWAVTLVAMLVAPSIALAASAPTVTKENREKGMAAAPAASMQVNSDALSSVLSFCTSMPSPPAQATS